MGNRYLEKIAGLIIDHATQQPVNTLPSVSGVKPRGVPRLNRLGTLLRHPLARAAGLVAGGVAIGRMSKKDSNAQ